EDLGDDAHHIRKVLVVGHHVLHGALSQSAVPDLPPAWRAERPRLAHREWREVVVVHEALELLESQAVQFLLILSRTERDDGERLGLAAREERGAMCPREHPDLAGDVTDLVGPTPVWSDPFVEDCGAHRLLELGLERLCNVAPRLREPLLEGTDRLVLELVDRRFPRRLICV